MGWAQNPRNLAIVHGDEGEWIATCSTPEIAVQIVTNHNSNATLGELFNNENQLEFEGFRNRRPLRVGVGRFDEHTDALVAITDRHLLPNPNQAHNGWTNKL